MALPSANRLAATGHYLWAGPATLLGLAAALASFSLPRIQGRIALSRSNRGFAHWFLTRRGYCAITLGHLVLTTPEASPEILAHEMVHVRQAERWGPLFLPAYLAAMLSARLKGKDPYWDNPFEIEARCRAEAVDPEADSHLDG